MKQIFNVLYPFVIKCIHWIHTLKFGISPNVTSTPGNNYYKSTIYATVGMWTLVLALGLVLIFYFLFNGKKYAFLYNLEMYKRKHWWAVALLAAGIGALIAHSCISAASAPYLKDVYSSYFIVANAVVAIIFFFLFSLALRRWSTNASSRPF